MAKRKQKTAKSVRKSTAQHSEAEQHPGTLPAGYKMIGRAPNWDVEAHPVIEGPRGEVSQATTGRGTGAERTTRVMVVTDDTIGPVTVWESGMLRDFFDQTQAGQIVRLEYIGLGEAKKGQNAPKLFVCAVKE